MKHFLTKVQNTEIHVNVFQQRPQKDAPNRNILREVPYNKLTIHPNR